jgi:hypothetical protein
MFSRRAETGGSGTVVSSKGGHRMRNAAPLEMLLSVARATLLLVSRALPSDRPAAYTWT